MEKETPEETLTRNGVINRELDNSAKTLHMQIGGTKYEAVVKSMKEYHAAMLSQPIPTEEEIFDTFYDFAISRLENGSYAMELSQFKAAIKLLAKGGKS